MWWASKTRLSDGSRGKGGGGGGGMEWCVWWWCGDNARLHIHKRQALKCAYLIAIFTYSGYAALLMRANADIRCLTGFSV